MYILSVYHYSFAMEQARVQWRRTVNELVMLVCKKIGVNSSALNIHCEGLLFTCLLMIIYCCNEYPSLTILTCVVLLLTSRLI